MIQEATQAGNMPSNAHADLNLDPHHYRDLKSSGLTDETIRECGFYTEGSYSKLATFIGWKGYPKRMGSALVIPFRSIDGDLDGYKRIKPSMPKTNRNGRLSVQQQIYHASPINQTLMCI